LRGGDRGGKRQSEPPPLQAGQLGRADRRFHADRRQGRLIDFFCATGLKKLSPIQLQLHYINFTPTADLAILILTPRGPE
jgi:hypothetical protein